MNYSIKVNKLENKDWSTKAFVSIVFEESLKVTDITVKKAKNGELFVAMPGYKTSKTDEQGNEFTKIIFTLQQRNLEKSCMIILLRHTKAMPKKLTLHQEKIKWVFRL